MVLPMAAADKPTQYLHFVVLEMQLSGSGIFPLHEA